MKKQKLKVQLSLLNNDKNRNTTKERNRSIYKKYKRTLNHLKNPNLFKRLKVK